MKNIYRRLAAAGVVAAVLSYTPAPRAQAVPAIDRKITYILPQFPEFLSQTDSSLAAHVSRLRTKIGEGRRVKVGFTLYIAINLTPVDPGDLAGIRASLQPSLVNIDKAIGLARTAGIPICFSFLTQGRETYDEAQTAAQAADQRTAQWHMDNSAAPGWMTLSRYSRKDVLLREAFFRELGKQLAARMLLYPDTVVAGSGDGEVELAFDKTLIADASYTPETSLLADYSPFAVAEFRDWLRQGGLYAAGQAFAGEAYSLSSRYSGDASPNADTNGDGHTLNGDFGTNFMDWRLLHHDWALTDAINPDPKALPLAVPFTKLAGQIPAGFDAPRVRNVTNNYWKIWDQFRQTMVWRHNLTIAKWVTTSADPASGATVPADRWFTDQIAADYLFTNVAILPSNPTGLTAAPGFRYDTSASPHWTADVTPYGSMGITSFNFNAGPTPAVNNERVYYRTLAAVAPVIAARNVRWGLFEWNPSVLADTDRTIYDLEMAILEKTRPSLLAPYAWNKIFFDQLIEDTPFELALKDYVNRRNNVPLTLNKSLVYASTLTDGSVRSAPQEVRVTGEPGESPTFNASSASSFVDIVKSVDGRSFTVGLKQAAYAAGVQSATVTVTPADATAGYASSTLTLNVTATTPAATKPPVGAFDTPADLAVVTGEVGFTGWAVDDVGIKSIDIYRAPLSGELTQSNGLVYLGSAGQVDGARPDIEATYGTIPDNSKAGWGYMLLSNFLPNSGVGIFTITVTVTDLDGHTVTLGTRRIDCRNASAVTPFGTLDTPLQGQTVSGTIVNFGWALTPKPNTIPFDGSTIDVVIDGAIVGHPVYNNYRSDIATLFPGLNNTGTPGGGGAVGYFYIDTTTLTNGVHTIAWIVRDNGGNATGMGSRYFTVANP